MARWFFVVAAAFSHTHSKNLEQEWEEEMARLERERLMEMEKQKDELTVESDAALQNLEQVGPVASAAPTSTPALH